MLWADFVEDQPAIDLSQDLDQSSPRLKNLHRLKFSLLCKGSKKQKTYHRRTQSDGDVTLASSDYAMVQAKKSISIGNDIHPSETEAFIRLGVCLNRRRNTGIVFYPPQ